MIFTAREIFRINEQKTEKKRLASEVGARDLGEIGVEVFDSGLRNLLAPLGHKVSCRIHLHHKEMA